VVVVRQTSAAPVAETPVAPETVQIAFGVTVGFAEADVVDFVAVGVAVVVVFVGCGDVDVFTGSVAFVVGALVGSAALVVAFVGSAFVGSVFGAAGRVLAGVRVGSEAAVFSVGAAWLGSVAFDVTRAVELACDDEANGRCFRGSEEATSGAAMAPTATRDRSPPPTMPSLMVRLNDANRPRRRRPSDGPEGIRYGCCGLPVTYDMPVSLMPHTRDVSVHVPPRLRTPPR